jgi:dimethylaniline monooxygenase (N-oxide forming)
VLPRYFFGRLRVDRVVFTRLSEWLLPAYHRTSTVNAALRVVAAPLIWLWRRTMSGIVPRLTGMPAGMVPETPVTSGSESIGIGERFFQLLREGSVHARRSGIRAFSGGGLLELDTGEQLKADVVIFATGWQQEVPFLEPGLAREVLRDGRFHLFRNILPPGERRMGFVGYASSSNCPLTAEVSAHWLAHWFGGDLNLPGAAEMEREIARVRNWTRRTFPKRDAGYFIGPYVAHYVDELLRDMDFPTRRMTNVIAEYVAPLWAERYAGLAKERGHAMRGSAPLLRG